MQQGDETLREAAVWSGALRLTHWLTTAAVLVLLGSGWLLHEMPGAFTALDLHLATGYALAAVLALRLYLLLFGHGAEHWRDLLPLRGRAAAATLWFYLSLGRRPLPAWYAHNPFWAPLYLMLWLLLGAATASGVALRHLPGAAAWAEGCHGPLAAAIGLWTLLHVAAVALHDWRGGTADVSAMLSGRRLFRLRRPEGVPLEVPVRDLLRRRDD